ncbi:peptidoglycan-binding protein [Cohnella nanjingensis]|uniref:peptidoglycan-binding protein n=1 Tax=Cohnella nanjingensis TaxID=1387779 RepID=UPI001C86A03C|nr:peptidoglycan-binding protein [Cohnella nanjingensis]
MTNVKRITDLIEYQSVLPYASELFGVHQSLIGWKSKRVLNKLHANLKFDQSALLPRLQRYLANNAPIDVNQDCYVSAPDLRPAGFAGPFLKQQDSIVLQAVSAMLREFGGIPRNVEEWKKIVSEEVLRDILQRQVLETYNQASMDACKRIARANGNDPELMNRLREQSKEETKKAIENEAVIAGVLSELFNNERVAELLDLFYANLNVDAKAGFFDALSQTDVDFDDPYLSFDPKKDVKDVSLSPLGIVHLYRQYFFELDTFLGTPTGHVWLSPGATVELIEVSTRKTIIEKTTEISVETTKKTESSTTDQDEISEAVKQDNKDDLKLGITTTVNQSWGTGSASATASLNMDKTQQVARETTHKKMRQQSEKLSSEIRENYKSTFKTITETTDTSSKRYVLTNTTEKLINYELRRKMRQVGVQVQDVGTYLCWEAYVDEPGDSLGLANLIHIAQPANLLPIPDQTEIPVPPDQFIPLKTNAQWNFGGSRKYGFVTVATVDPPAAPEGFEIVKEAGVFPAAQMSGSGEDFTGVWAFGARFATGGQIEIGVITGPGGIEWNQRIDFTVGTVVKCTASAAKKAEIAAANTAKKLKGEAATAENDRITKETFIKSAKERVELARGIAKRNFEELREEERIIVYRKLIGSLMTGFQYHSASDSTRHVLSELLLSIFDIDKMLYFVAPEWWKPRAYQHLNLPDLQSQLDGSVVAWSDSAMRQDNYLITEKSAPAPMGSSLGWLLQLDGDNLRNAFLNAPWVKAVIPIRPGKEQAALNWLQNANVEGSDGLDAAYAAPEEELAVIRAKLGLDPSAAVTIRQAIDFLCLEVKEKSEESNQVKSYPTAEINDDNKVLSTPVEKVFEHGFYPLKGGFRVAPNDANPDPNNADRHFQVFDQWIEVLPTDQVVPVEVVYDPKTGRQI